MSYPLARMKDKDFQELDGLLKLTHIGLTIRRDPAEPLTDGDIGVYTRQVGFTVRAGQGPPEDASDILFSGKPAPWRKKKVQTLLISRSQPFSQPLVDNFTNFLEHAGATYTNSGDRLSVQVEHLAAPPSRLKHLHEMITALVSGSGPSEAEEELRRVIKGLPQSDSAKRRQAVEDYAMRAAQAYYEKGGWAVGADKHLTEPYDLECRRGDEQVHVEVKGLNSDERQTVILTRGEVKHFEECAVPTQLFVVRGIKLTTDPAQDTGFQASGGERLLLNPWRLDRNKLEPIAYEYELPEQLE